MVFMFEFILLIIGIVGFGIAGFLDLKTTEFPDYLPYSIIISALVVRGLFSYIIGDFQPLVSSLFIGSVFLSFGLVLYFLKQWGDGDAWLLGALGFLFPDSGIFGSNSIFPFPVTLLFNFFLISFIYLIVYSIVIGMRSGIERKFIKCLKGSIKNIVVIVSTFSAIALVIVFFIHFNYNIPFFALYPILLFPFLLTAVIIFVYYGRFIENELFKKRIPVSKLTLGDVPIDRKWRVLTKKELEELKKKGGHVWVKEGVRFAPVFLITLLITIFYGGLLF